MQPKSKPQYTPKYTTHLKPNERRYDVVFNTWTWRAPLKNAVHSMRQRSNGLYTIALHDEADDVDVRGSGMRPRDAYREAYRALRIAKRYAIEDVLAERAQLERKVERLLAERAELRQALLDARKQAADAAELRKGLDAVRSALADAVHTCTEGQPLDRRVAALVEHTNQLVSAQQKQAAVIAQLLSLVRKSAGEGSPTYARALSLARAVHVTAPASSEVPA
jgi:chromosome segregation ATPase